MKTMRPTESQVEVWLASQASDAANCAYNECNTLRLQGRLDADRLAGAWHQLCMRHEMLRASFAATGDQIVVHDEPKYEYLFDDWSDAGGHAAEDSDRWDKHRRAVDLDVSTPFDLQNGPLVRLRLQRFSDEEHLLTVTAHHLVLDGWSQWVLFRDLGHLYSGKSLPAADPYEDISLASHSYSNSEQAQLDEAFWLDQFSDGIPTLDLPTDRPRPMLKTFCAARCDYVVPAELTKAIRRQGAAAGCSLFHMMLVSFHAYLARLAGQDEFVLGVPAAGQPSLQMDNALGHCVNTLPFRNRVDLSRSLGDAASTMQQRFLDALDHQGYTFGMLLRKLAPPRDPSRPPVFSVMFNVDNAIRTSQFGFDGMKVDATIEPKAFSNFEWSMNALVTESDAMQLQLQYNTDLFDEVTVAGYLEGYTAFLETLVDQPDTPLHELPMLSLAQRRQVIVDWNRTSSEYPHDRCVHEQFTTVASANSDRVAVRFGESSTTYGELDEWSNRIARFLQEQGVAAGDLVGICVPRSHAMVATLLGIWKAGAGYVPLDPQYPLERLRYMGDQSELKLVVTQTAFVDVANELGKPIIDLDKSKAQIDVTSPEALPCSNSSRDIAYVIYTSGSTGKPKGVEVPHRAVLNFLFAMRDQPGCAVSDSVLALTTLSFDIAVLELYLPLLVGARVVVADSATASDGVRLASLIEESQVTILQATPATWRLLIDSGWQGSRSLKALCGGEPMPADLVAPLLDRVGALWNMYGPTETTVWSTCSEIVSADQAIHIGRPIANTQTYILDANQQPVPVGIPGELHIGGAGVTSGYRLREDLTRKQFIDHRWFNPFVENASSKIYKTGDLARYRADGNIEYLRRNDKQVKVRGYRIELGEVEASIQSHALVARTAVIVREDMPGDARLVAYTIPVDGHVVTSSDLRKHVQEKLPHYMVPQHFVQMEAFPQTNNGKVDYSAFPAPTGFSPSQNHYVAPETESELLLATLWCEHLQADAVSVSDNFFDIGGHSLLVMKVLASVADQTGVKLSPQDFLMSTLGDLAAKLPQTAADAPENLAVHPAPIRGGLLGKLLSPFTMK